FKLLATAQFTRVGPVPDCLVPTRGKAKYVAEIKDIGGIYIGAAYHRDVNSTAIDGGIGVVQRIDVVNDGVVARPQKVYAIRTGNLWLRSGCIVQREPVW